MDRLTGFAGVLTLLVLAGAASAVGDDETPTFDTIWGAMELYSGSDNALVQSFRLSGRLQLDWAYVDSGEDDHGEFNVRRFRFGFKTVFRKSFTVHLEGEFNPQEADPVYKRLTDAYLAWRPGERLTLTAGKHSAGFTLDGMTSSKSLLTIDRSNLSNNLWFTEEYMPGISIKGEVRAISYFFGVFSSGNETPEFGDFKGGEFLLLTLGHDFADRFGVDEALLRLNLVENEPDPNNGFTRPLDEIGSLNFSYSRGDWGLRADVSAAHGYYDQSDLWGLYVMPIRRFRESTEVVARYTLIESSDENGVRFARYERAIVDGTGDRYDEVYLGLNYYWYGHKLKLQNGLQWVEMGDRANDGGAYSGWSWTTAFRLSW